MAFCGYCGTKLEYGAQTCPSCGKPQGSAAPQPAPQPAPAPQPTAQVPPAGAQQSPYVQQPYAAPAPQPAPGYYQQPPVSGVQQTATVDLGTDFTASYTPRDISDGKVFALASYMLGIVGIVIALLAAQDSKFAMFHARESLKLQVANSLVLIFMVVLSWTIIVPIVGLVALVVILVITVVCFFRAAKGQAKTAPLIGTLKLFN